MVKFPYTNTAFAFTLNDVFIEFETETPDTYFTLEIEIEYYEFYSDVANSKTTLKKIPLFNNYAKYNVGRIVHRYMRSINSLNLEVNQYKTAKVSLTVKEVLESDLSVLSTEVLTDIPFIAGYLPKRFENNMALLHRNVNPCRITNLGFVNVSFLLPAGTQIFKIFKNQIEVYSEVLEITEGNNVITKKIDAASFNAEPGDQFHVKIDETNIYYDFVIFPKGLHSKMIVFLNEFNLKSSLECIGGYSIKTDYYQVEEIVLKNLQQVLKIIETTKKESFFINTGFLLKTDVISIDSMLMHKKAWLVVSEDEIIELVPVSKKQTGIDTSKDLYEYDLEFKINASNNAQNYTF